MFLPQPLAQLAGIFGLEPERHPPAKSGGSCPRCRASRRGTAVAVVAEARERLLGRLYGIWRRLGAGLLAHPAGAFAVVLPKDAVERPHRPDAQPLGDVGDR